MLVRDANFNAPEFRQALGRFATGVAIITTKHPETEQPIGITVSSFNAVSMNPPLVLWSLQNTCSSLTTYQRAPRYNIHILSADHMMLAMHFSKDSQDKRFENLEYSLNEFGIPVLPSHCSAAYFECYNKTQYKEGDHHIMIGQVERCSHSDHMPLVFHAGTFDLTPSVQKNK